MKTRNAISFKMLQVKESNAERFVKDIDWNKYFIDEFKVKWDNLHDEIGVFRYQIEHINERIVDNKYLLQLNPNRGTNRRKPEGFVTIYQPFNKEKFNFTKVADKEVLFTFTSDNESDKHAIVINVSPINRYHSLLCPSIDKCLPQVVTKENLKLALDLMYFIDNRELKIGFNSLCGFASVNHLHYHLLFERRTLSVETAKCKHLKGSLYCLDGYVIPAFCFEMTQSHNTEDLARDIFKLVQCMLQKSIAHNILFTLSKSIRNPDEEAIRVFIWPRKSSTGAKTLGVLNVGVCELSGWFLVYDIWNFAEMQSENLENELQKWKYDEFTELCEEVKLLF